MKKTLKFALVASVVLLTMIFFGEPSQREVAGQSSSRNSPTPVRQQYAPAQQNAPVQQPFEVKFWNYLKSAQYKNWAPSPGTDGTASDGESPHGAKLKMYLNRVAVSNPKELPHGSIIVKENYGPDAKTLMAITAMYRSKGFDQKNYDWYWVKFMPDGTVARTPTNMGSMPIKGKFKSCIECHGGADGGDFSFLND